DLREDTIEGVMEASAEILKVAIESGGALSGEHGIGLEKNHFMFWVYGPEDLEAMQRARSAFDPDGAMNPGKIFPGGDTCAAIPAERARAGQRWPVDVADPERATIGGTIASAAPSPSRLRHQHVRDWVIGCTAVLGDGTVARAGGRVVKNVTGYDLARLYSGTFGTLAVLAEVSLKLSAIDEAVRAFRVDESAYEDLRHLPLDSLVLTTGHTRGLYVRVAGLAAAVERVSRELARYHATEIASVAWDQTVHPSTDAADLTRASVPPWREREVAIG